MWSSHLFGSMVIKSKSWWNNTACATVKICVILVLCRMHIRVAVRMNRVLARETLVRREEEIEEWIAIQVKGLGIRNPK